MARTRTIPILRSNQSVVRTKINAANMHLYSRQIVNARGKVAYVKKSSEVRALEVVRGSGRRLRRVRYTAKDGSGSLGKRKDHGERKGVNPELDLVAIVPEGSIKGFKDDLGEAIEAAMSAAGLPGVVRWHVVSNDPAPSGTVGVESAVVYTYGRAEPQTKMSQAVWDLAQNLLDKLGGVGGVGDSEEAERILRAVQRTDRLGRTYWVDPVTGRRTLSPEAVR